MKTNNLSDLLPVAVHYDGTTLMNKNGELVQLIEIKGYSKRFNAQSILNLREAVRETLNSLLSQDVMFYLYVKRDFVPMNFSANFLSEFAQMKHNMWLERNSFKSCLMNTLYIGIVHEGAKSLLTHKHFADQIFLKKTIACFSVKLQAARDVIASISVEILAKLEQYGVNLLSIVKKNEKLISEPLSFLYYLIHSREKDVEISQADYSKLLTYNLNIKHEYNEACLGTDNSLELDWDGNLKVSEAIADQSYINILTFKHASDLATKYTDQLLNLDQQMVVTETIRLADKESLLEQLKKSQKIYEITKTNVATQIISGMMKELEAHHAILSQISMKIVAPTKELLHEKMNKTKELINRLGISTIKEDYYMIGAFFSAIPGNAHFLRRENSTIMSQAAVFASIKPKSLGGYNGSIWGNPITVFKTTEGLPYFFNFHNNNNIGHTIIVGEEEHGNSLLRNFLVLESLQFDARFVDLFCGNTKEIITMCDGMVEENFSIDMLTLIDNDIKMFYTLISFMLFDEHTITGALQEALLEVLTRIHNILLQDKNAEVALLVSKINDIFSLNDLQINSDIKYALSQFFSEKLFFRTLHLSSVPEGKILAMQDLLGTADLQSKFRTNIQSITTFLYIKQLDKELSYSNLQPVILSVDHTILLLPAVLKDEFQKIMIEIAKKNVVVIVTCQNKEFLYLGKETQEIIKNIIPTRFFLSDKFIDRNFKNLFELSDLEMSKIKMYNPSEHIFLLQQDASSITASFKILNTITIQN